MEAVPRETVDIWMVHPKLNPRLLIPSLLRYDHNTISDKVTQVTQDYAESNLLVTRWVYSTRPSVTCPMLSPNRAIQILQSTTRSWPCMQPNPPLMKRLYCPF